MKRASEKTGNPPKRGKSGTVCIVAMDESGLHEFYRIPANEFLYLNDLDEYIDFQDSEKLDDAVWGRVDTPEVNEYKRKQQSAENAHDRAMPWLWEEEQRKKYLKRKEQYKGRYKVGSTTFYVVKAGL